MTIPEEPAVTGLPSSPSSAFCIGWRMGYAADRWQPIETAPKDGTEFLAWFPLDEMVCVCWWHEFPHREFESCWEGSFGHVGEESDHAPTHWQPLPNPPEGE